MENVGRTLAEQAMKRGFVFSQEARRDLSDMFDKAVRLHRLSLSMLESEHGALAEEETWIPNQVKHSFLYKDTVVSCACELNPGCG